MTVTLTPWQPADCDIASVAAKPSTVSELARLDPSTESARDGGRLLQRGTFSQISVPSCAGHNATGFSERVAASCLRAWRPMGDVEDADDSDGEIDRAQVRPPSPRPQRCQARQPLGRVSLRAAQKPLAKNKATFAR